MDINADKRDIWSFPEKITFESAAEYIFRFNSSEGAGHYVFDLRETVELHSSFIGFLIHVKHSLNLKEGKLTLMLSYTVERLLILLNILDYFSPEIIVDVKKSA